MKAAFLLLCAFCVGCDTINQTQYRVASASSADRALVRTVLRSVATRAKFTDQTATSRAPDTLAFYSQPEIEHFRVELGARAVGNAILVDLSAGFGPQPAAYKRAYRLLGPALAQSFGTRVSEVRAEPVPWERPNHALQPTAGASGAHSKSHG